jgi:hypothetical protein
MKIGFIISMYDEIEQVKANIDILKQEDYKIIVIQSDPKQANKILDNNSVDHYELLSDLAGSIEKYHEERTKKEKGSSIPAKALSRNFSHAFTAAKNFSVDWWVAILGDVRISKITGIRKQIDKIISNNKYIGITRAVGQTFLDEESEFTRIQKTDSTDFMPQFFIVKAELVNKGLFNNIRISNKYTTEQCLGDEVLRFCNENNFEYGDICYSISDYAYPQFIEGLDYNPDRIKMPKYIDGVVNRFRKWKMCLK